MLNNVISRMLEFQCENSDIPPFWDKKNSETGNSKHEIDKAIPHYKI